VPRKSRTISQTQLAEELGISQALVSLILNGRRQGIHSDTYDRVWDHAMRRGYHPKGMRLDPRALSLFAKQVAVVLRRPLRLHSLSRYFSLIQEGLHSALQEEGLTVTYLGAEDTLDAPRLERLLPGGGHGFRGLVIFGQVSRDFLDRLLQQESPIVSICASFPGLCHSVASNEAQSLTYLVKHLRDLGHQRIGWIGGSPEHERHDLRLDAFRSALAGVGLTLDPRYTVIRRESDRAAGADAIFTLAEHQRRRDFPSAFICYNCLMAAGAIRALEHEGWSVPDDVSIVGADRPRPDSAEGRRITGAGTDPILLGAAAAGLLTRSNGSTPASPPSSIPAAGPNGCTNGNSTDGNGSTPPARLGHTMSLNGKNGHRPAASPGFVDLVLPSELVVATSCGPAPA
jgi:LacI family transcriptional regulator